MSKIRLLFLGIIFIISAVCMGIFSRIEAPFRSVEEKAADFIVTKISGSGKVYFHQKPMEGNDLSFYKTVDIKQMDYEGEMYLKSDSFTAFEFYFSGIYFNALPGSYLYFQPRTRELYFFTGEFFWRRELKGEKVSVSFLEPQDIASLSNSGRVRLIRDSVQVWNYDGGMDLNFIGEDFHLGSSQLFSFVIAEKQKSKSPEIFGLLPVPQNIDPDRSIITLRNADDSVVRFNWSVVRGSPRYLFRIYTSNLRENALYNKLIDINRVNVDLFQFEEREFYWEVIPVDSATQREGIPSKMGYIKLIGSLFGKKNIQKPPALNVNDITTIGNLVIIKGNADVNSQLFIDNELVKIDQDGTFIHTKKFTSIGIKTIFFRLVSPLGLETTVERQVTIYEE